MPAKSRPGSSEEAVRKSTDDLRQLNLLKGKFVAMASHELRTPLTSIAGFSSTLLNKWTLLSEHEKLDFVSIIDGQSQRMSRLVEDLLTRLGNAVRHGAPPFGIEALREDGSVQLRVTDQGAGLGLSIIKSLCAAHGGEAWYEPNEPQGSAFCVSLPESRSDQLRQG